LLFKVCWAGLKAAVVGCKCVSLLLLPSIHKSSIISVPNLHPVHFMELDVCGPNVKYSISLTVYESFFKIPCLATESCRSSAAHDGILPISVQ